MKYQDVMEVLSQCGLGCILLSRDGTVEEINRRGDCLLHGEGKLVGTKLKEWAEPLCDESNGAQYVNAAFGEYLTRCPTPDTSNLPEGTKLIVFRDATNDACHDMLINVVNQIEEGIAMYDSQGRLYLLNDATVKMENIVTRDVCGENVEDIYSGIDQSLLIPKVLQTKRTVRNQRISYMTKYGCKIDALASDYPIVQNGQMLGACCVLKDWSTTDRLYKQVIELQEKLTERSGKSKKASGSALRARYCFDDIVHISPQMHRVVEQCKRIAKSDSSVMIYGETGTGKELFAQSIHNASKRSKGPFLAINCAAIPENLLESLLFGTEKGAYTGAESREGLFEQANCGTLLLDEINSMDITLQSKLLRVLQEGCVRRIGGMREIPVDVRVLSNINLPPDRAIAENKLRRDLFYRLGVVNINIPPLRERKDDIPLLTQYFIIRCNEKLGRDVRKLDQKSMEIFQQYDWRGNVRELQHAIEHAMNILPDQESAISPDYLPTYLTGERQDRIQKDDFDDTVQDVIKREESLNSTIQGIERHTICRVLKETGGNISRSARILQISRQNLQYRIKRYNIDVASLLRE